MYLPSAGNKSTRADNCRNSSRALAILCNSDPNNVAALNGISKEPTDEVHNSLPSSSEYFILQCKRKNDVEDIVSKNMHFLGFSVRHDSFVYCYTSRFYDFLCFCRNRYLLNNYFALLKKNFCNNDRILENLFKN